MRNRKSFGEKIFDAFNYIFLIMISVIAIVPFIHIIAGSFATPAEIASKKLLLFPTAFSLDAYRFIFSTSTLLNSLMVTIFITVVGTIVNIILTSTFAYSLSHKVFLGRRIIMFLITFTMIFSPGLIPHYILIKRLGLIDSIWSLIIPGAISAFYVILWKNFFQQIPSELEEAAMIDGYSEISIFAKIIIPLSVPVIATFTLFYAVGHWNTFTAALYYINDAEKWPIQVLLRQIVISTVSFEENPEVYIPPQTVKMAVIVVATVPILVVYPFLQKHFTKGLLLGSVKG